MPGETGEAGVCISEGDSQRREERRDKCVISNYRRARAVGERRESMQVRRERQEGSAEAWARPTQ